MIIQAYLITPMLMQVYQKQKLLLKPKLLIQNYHSFFPPNFKQSKKLEFKSGK